MILNKIFYSGNAATDSFKVVIQSSLRGTRKCISNSDELGKPKDRYTFGNGS